MGEGTTEPPAQGANARTGTNGETHLSLLAAANGLIAGAILFMGLIPLLWAHLFQAWFPFWMGGSWIAAALGAAGIFVLMLAVMAAVAPLVAAIGLAKRRPWGRVWGFISAGEVALLGWSLVFPLIYTVYAIWALVQPEVVAALEPARRPQPG